MISVVSSVNTFTLSTYTTPDYTQFVGLSTGLFLPVSVNGVYYKMPLFYPGGITITSVTIS